MGYANDALIRQCELARICEVHDEVVRLSVLIDESQVGCPHPPEDRKPTFIRRDSPSGKYKRGRPCVLCLRCSKIVEYEGEKT